MQNTPLDGSRLYAILTWKLNVDVIVNGETRVVNEGATVHELLQALRMDPRYLAVEINRELCPRATHAATVLQADDQVEIVTLVGGG